MDGGGKTRQWRAIQWNFGPIQAPPMSSRLSHPIQSYPSLHKTPNRVTSLLPSLTSAARETERLCGRRRVRILHSESEVMVHSGGFCCYLTGDAARPLECQLQKWMNVTLICPPGSGCVCGSTEMSVGCFAAAGGASGGGRRRPLEELCHRPGTLQKHPW